MSNQLLIIFIFSVLFSAVKQMYAQGYVIHSLAQ
jgi:hypothetical protein